jgi:hypothetical protein
MDPQPHLGIVHPDVAGAGHATTNHVPTTVKEALMILIAHRALVAAGLAVTLAACATAPSSSPSLSKPGFYTEVKDGRLWVFREGSKELTEFKQHGEPAKQVTRIGGGPNGMTIKSSDAKVIDDYMAAR